MLPFIKKILSSPFLKRFLSWDNWPYWLAALTVIALVVLLIFVIKRRRAKEAEPVSEKPKEEHLQRSTLANVWKEFLRGIPREFRRSIMLYQHFVVIGEAGVGKSQLIDTYTDWQGRASQFYPSYTVNPLLQIYLGSKVVVQETPAALLNDTSKSVRAALLKLWNPLLRKSEPTVVAVLNGAALQSETPDSLKRQAQMIRGKVNILSRLRKKPVKVCIALTHMDQREGFLEFSAFLRQNNIPLALEFDSKADLQDLKTCLESYEAYLTLALTTLPAGDYLKVISFLRYAPELFSALSVFIKILQNPDPLSLEPEVVRLSLSAPEVKDSIISNPFVDTLSAKDVRTFHPLRKHMRIAAALVILGIGYLGAAYAYEYRLLSKADRAMDAIEASPPAQYNQDIHQLFMDFTFSLKKDPLLALLPNFFPDVDQAIKRRAIRNIQKLYLFPKLRRLAAEEDAQEKTLYLLALIYASKHNDLGKLVRENIAEWTQLFDVSRVAIEDYVNNNEEDYLNNNVNFKKLFLPLDNLHLDKPKGITPDQDLRPWIVYFQQIKESYQTPLLTSKYLQRLQAEADSLLQVIQAMDRYDLSARICELLKRETTFAIQTDWLERRDSELRQESLRKFLGFLREKDISYPSVKDLNIDQLLKNVKAMTLLRDRGEKKFQFGIAGQEFLFTAGKWNELVDGSRITWVLRDFITQNKWHDGLLFFQTESVFPDLVMNPSNDGDFFFGGRGKVDGRFTKDAFERRVKPVLLEMPEFLKGLSIPEGEKKRFSNFVFNEAAAYAEGYVSEFLHYYRQFNVQAESLGELRYVLTQMQMPSSEFQDFLLTMKENTVLDLGDNPYLRPLALRLRKFGFIQRLMQERKGAYPELDKYRAILAQMQGDLENDAAPVAENEADDTMELKQRLSPLGRTSMAIFRSEPDSYLKLANKWLKSVGGDGQGWQDPFLAPVYETYDLGLAEVKATVKKVWEDLWKSDVQPLLADFPFNKRTETVLSSSVLEAALHPQKGRFWETFRRFLAPVCVERGGVWRRRQFSRGSLRLPRDMLETVNGISRLTRTLWDEKGAPQPVTFSIKPLPLPLRQKHEPTVILSYLKSGTGSVFGFNQQPSWQDFKLEWWKDQAAAAGVELATSKKSRKNYRQITVPESTWSFYRLLQKAEPVNTDVVTWRIQSPETRDEFLEIRFAIKNDPWAMFRLNRQG